MIDLNPSRNLAARPRAGCLLPLSEPFPGRKPVLALLMRLLWAAALVLPAFGAQAAVVFTTLHSFEVFPNGANPEAGLVQGSDGNFYGTTAYGGGTNNAGTVFKINTNGALTTLYFFTGGKDGGNPQAGLVQGTDGNFYGTTANGGKNSYYGTVFKISTSGALTTLYAFGTVTNASGQPLDGSQPSAGLVQGSDGYFYGTTASGGTYTNWGTVFQISTNGVLTTLHSFTGGNDGSDPYAGLVQGSDGNFYGTTSYGGKNFYYGTVFKISTSGTLTTLYAFGSITNASYYPLDGSYPQAALVQGSDGNFYGTTTYGGTYTNFGTVFKISTNGALTTLRSFTGGNDAGYPYAGLVQGSDGNFYGTTYSSYNVAGWGTVFRITTNGVLTTLHTFTGGNNDGKSPHAGLVQGSDGNFYGTTEGSTGLSAGTGGGGTVFQITTNGTLTGLYSFPVGTDGAQPTAGLLQSSDGSLYGTTQYGGTNGAGTVFKISTNGALTTLYSFTGGNDGSAPYAGLVWGGDGNFYGTTARGGKFGLASSGFAGTVFKISTNGTLTTLYSFTGGGDGGFPQAGLVQGTDSNFYGTTTYGGMGWGTVFKIPTSGVLKILYSFTGGDDGGFPQAALVQGTDGNFYGTTESGGAYSWGNVFRITTTAELTSVHPFTGGNDGSYPYAGLVQASDGNFYGTTLEGGKHNSGVVFKMRSNGALTALYAFGSITNANGDPLDGESPQAGLVQASDGYLYGTTAYGGGPSYSGTVFKISTNGALTTLYAFGSITNGNGEALDGSSPQAGLVQGSDGRFYGTTAYGGQGGAGTVFRLTIVPPPQLTIIPYEPYVILTWPTDYAGFSYAGYTLQSTTNLGSSAVWTTVSPEPFVIGEENVVINTISGAHQFYRLIQ